MHTSCGVSDAQIPHFTVYKIVLYLNSVAVTLDGEVKEGENMQLLFA